MPPVSRRTLPRLDRSRRADLADAFGDDPAGYDDVRPGYPDEVLEAVRGRGRAHAGDGVVEQAVEHVVELGAGTGKLTTLLVGAGLDVTAVEPDARLHGLLAQTGPARIVTASAEDTGLAAGSADAVVAAQAWHWFDPAAARAEARRLLVPDGALVLIWNTMDVSVPWIHRLARIMHAGDVLRENAGEDMAQALAPQFGHVEARTIVWEDRLSVARVTDLARTRSHYRRASEEHRARIDANLDWYLHAHLGYGQEDDVPLRYRTDVFTARVRD